MRGEEPQDGVDGGVRAEQDGTVEVHVHGAVDVARAVHVAAAVELRGREKEVD